MYYYLDNHINLYRTFLIYDLLSYLEIAHYGPRPDIMYTEDWQGLWETRGHYVLQKYVIDLVLRQQVFSTFKIDQIYKLIKCNTLV